jgi:hypothetical protein
MFRTNKRSKTPRKVNGPRLGAFVTSSGEVTVRIVQAGERPTLPAATVLAVSGARAAVAAAAAIVAARIQAHATRPVTVTVLA